MIADHTDSTQVAGRLKLASKRIHDMANEVGHARQVKEFIGDMKKNLLAGYIVPFLKDGETSSAAESKARAEEQFLIELRQLQEQYEAAEKIIARWQAEQVAWDSARSLLSFEKETIRELS